MQQELPEADPLHIYCIFSLAAYSLGQPFISFSAVFAVQQLLYQTCARFAMFLFKSAASYVSLRKIHIIPLVPIGQNRYNSHSRFSLPRQNSIVPPIKPKKGVVPFHELPILCKRNSRGRKILPCLRQITARGPCPFFQWGGNCPG